MSILLLRFAHVFGWLDATVYFRLLICVFLSICHPHSVFPPCQFPFHPSPLTDSPCFSTHFSLLCPSPPFPASAEEWGGFVPPTLARDEWNPGPEEAGAGGPPHPWPHEGRQAAHHSEIGLGQRVSRRRAERRRTKMDSGAVVFNTPNTHCFIVPSQRTIFLSLIHHRLNFATSFQIDFCPLLGHWIPFTL